VQIHLLTPLMGISIAYFLEWIVQFGIVELKNFGNYTGSRSLSLSKVKADGANRFGFDRLSRRCTHFLTNTFTVTNLFVF